MRIIHAIVGTCLGAFASGCAGKRPSPATDLPVPLVNSLIDQVYDEDRGHQYAVGKLPTGFPDGLRPTGATVVGGMRTTGSIVAVFADSSRQLAPVIEGLFEAHGFK